MKLKCIIDVNRDKELYEQYVKIRENLNNKFSANSLCSLRDKVFEEHNMCSNYHQNVHTGKIKSGIELTELEVSMICDNGFSHFGGSSIITNDGRFTVKIWTD